MLIQGCTASVCLSAASNSHYFTLKAFLQCADYDASDRCVQVCTGVVPWPGGGRCTSHYNPGTSSLAAPLYSPATWTTRLNKTPDTRDGKHLNIQPNFIKGSYHRVWECVVISDWMIMSQCVNKPWQSSCSSLCVSVSMVSDTASRNHGYTWHRSYWGQRTPSWSSSSAPPSSSSSPSSVVTVSRFWLAV